MGFFLFSGEFIVFNALKFGQNAFGIRGLLCTFTWSKNPGKNLSILVIGSNGTCIGCSHVRLPKFNSIRGFKILTERRKGVALLK